MRYSQLFAALAVICVLLPAASAHGQAGTRPDPDSPAGVEYQLPLQQARQNASESGGDKPGGGGGAGRGTVPLFGAGIAKKGGGGRGSDPGGRQGDGGSGTGSRASASDGEDSRGGNAGPGDPAVSRSGVGGSESDDGSAALRIGGIALAVLLAGGLLGLGLRRGLQQTGD